MKALFDTNILIDYLNGIEQARLELRRYDQPLISPISWMEVLVGTNHEDEPLVRRFLARLQPVPIDQAVAEHAITLRKTYRMRLPDAIIWASAKTSGALLVSRNTRDFPASEPDVRIPYSIP